MKNKFLLLLVFLAVSPSLHAATNFIILGDDFQTKIDAAAPGDTLVVQAGVYSGNLNFNKALTVLRSGTNQIQFLGTVQITGAGNSSFQFSQFASAVTIQATGTISFAQSQFLATLFSQGANVLMSQVTSSDYIQANLTQGSGTNFQAYDSSLWQLEFIGGKTLLKRCSINKAGFTTLTLSSNAAFEGLRITNTGVCSAEATLGSVTPFVLAQSSFTYGLSLTGYKAWLGYNSVSTSYPNNTVNLTDCDTVMIGNRLNPGNPVGTTAAIRVVRGNFTAYNNKIEINTDNNASRDFYGIRISGGTNEIINNTIKIFHSDNTIGGLVRTRGISADTGGALVLRANIISITYTHTAGYLDDAGLDASVQQVLALSYCDFNVQGGPAWTSGTGVNMLYLDPLFDSDLSLPPNSPCFNSGPPDAIYNDRDGSRNDMGYTGGPYWNPANYTNSNPMVFFLSGSPQTVLKGVQTNITVNAAASAGH